MDLNKGKRQILPFCLPVKSMMGQRIEPGFLEISLYCWAILPLHTRRILDKKTYGLYTKKTNKQTNLKLYFLYDVQQYSRGSTELPSLRINYVNMTYHKDSVKTVVLCEELNHLGQRIFFSLLLFKGEKQSQGGQPESLGEPFRLKVLVLKGTIGSRCAEKQNKTAGRKDYLGLRLFLLLRVNENSTRNYWFNYSSRATC